jgi:cell wall-associated NlpC family hydrolase
MTTRADVVSEARRWLATPFQHQGRTIGLGTDCGGLVGGVAVSLGLFSGGWWDQTFDPAHGGYSRSPSGGMLDAICARYLAPAEMQPGAVLLMRFAGEPQHLAIVGDYAHGGLSLIHAYSVVGAVTEHALDARWQRRTVAAFDFPGIA